MNADPGYSPLKYRSYKREQARISRKRLYTLTAFYALYSVLMITLGWRSAHKYVALFSYFMGVPVWTLVEYVFHRYVLHHSFGPTSDEGIKGIIGRFCNK